MADQKISQLTPGGPAQAGDELPVARSGTNVKLTANEIASLPIAQQTLTGGTVTVSTPVINATQTWNAPAITTTGASGNGTTATITFAAQPTAFPIGSTIVVAGITPTGYRGTFVVTGSTTTSVSYANATTGAQTVAGTVQQVMVGLDYALQMTASAATSRPIDIRVTDTAFPNTGVRFAINQELSNFNQWGVHFTGSNVSINLGNGQALSDTRLRLLVGGLQIVSNATVSWSSFTNNLGTLDLQLFRDAADTMAQRRTTNAQTFRWYRTFTDASNYERGALQTGAGQVIVAAETAGTGTDDIDVTLTPAGTGLVRYGTHSAIGVETVTGFIEIKDAGGTIRKIAVVS